MGLKALKIVGFIFTGLGAVLSIGSGIVSDKILDYTIDEKVSNAIAKK